MAAAIRYTLSRWQALTLMLRDGRVCIDNNAAERSMRPMCLGRKNWAMMPNLTIREYQRKFSSGVSGSAPEDNSDPSVTV